MQLDHMVQEFLSSRDEMSEEMCEFRGEFGEAIGSMSCEAFVAAETIEADRLVFGSPRKFDPVSCLDSKTAAMYEEPGLSAEKKLDLCPEFQSEPLFLRNCLCIESWHLRVVS